MCLLVSGCKWYSLLGLKWRVRRGRVLSPSFMSCRQCWESKYRGRKIKEHRSQIKPHSQRAQEIYVKNQNEKNHGAAHKSTISERLQEEKKKEYLTGALYFQWHTLALLYIITIMTTHLLLYKKLGWQVVNSQTVLDTFTEFHGSRSFRAKLLRRCAPPKCYYAVPLRNASPEWCYAATSERYSDIARNTKLWTCPSSLQESYEFALGFLKRLRRIIYSLGWHM